MKKYSELRSNGRKDLTEIVPLNKPYTIAIDPSSICNFRCKCCPQGNETGGGTHVLLKNNLCP